MQSYLEFHTLQENFGSRLWPEKKLPNIYKSCPKMISQQKWKILTPLQKLPKNVQDLGKLNITIGFKKLPKVQLIAQSGHTGTD